MTHCTNIHTFKQHPSVCTNKSIKLRLSYSFLDFIPTTTDLPSTNLSDQEKMMELEQQNKIDSEALQIVQEFNPSQESDTQVGTRLTPGLAKQDLWSLGGESWLVVYHYPELKLQKKVRNITAKNRSCAA